jgi:ribose transport system substrate-binding protein
MKSSKATRGEIMQGRKIIVALIVALLLAGLASAQDKKYLIGFSQLAFDDPWRVAFNNQMQAAADKHPEFELVIVNAERDSAKQVADVENLLQQQVDLLIISPNEAAPLTNIVKTAYDSGTPVIVLDRNVNGDAYTMFIGADNKFIGGEAGKYVAAWCEAQGFNPCNILEVTGLSGSTPAQERGEGFREGLAANPNTTITSVTSEWQKAKAMPAAAAAFQADNTFNVVYAHNDDSAEGAYIAAQNANMDLSKMLFLGIDGLPDKNGSIVSILQGRLGASFVYPNGAAEAIDWAAKILENGETPPKTVTLGTDAITPENAQEMCTKYSCEFQQ